MNLKKTKSILIILVLFLVACKDDAIRKAARASDDMATTVNLAIEAKRSLATSVPPLISHDEEVALTLGLQKVNAAVRVFHNQSKAMSSASVPNKTQLLDSLKSITQALADLNQTGVLGIKNPDAKQKVTLILSSFTALFATIQTALGGA